MEKGKGNKPSIRFPAFKDDWEFINGGEIFESVSDKNHNSDLPILAISQEHGAIPRELINYQISVTEKSVASYKVVAKGDFIISLRSFQGGIEYSNYKGICSPAYIILRPFIGIDRDFFKYYFKTFKYIQHLNSKLEGIRDGKMISYKYFSEIPLPFPTLPEQKRIASFFTAVDKKIAELKQKKALLEAYKKGVMQGIFANSSYKSGMMNDELKDNDSLITHNSKFITPLRFKDENGKEFPGWEKKTLGEIAELTSSKRVFFNDYVNEGIPFYRGKEITELKQNIEPKDVLFITEKLYIEFKEKYGVPEENDILITSVGTLGNVLRIKNNKPFYFKDGNLIWIKKITELSAFVEILLDVNRNNIEKISIGSTQKALTMVELRKLILEFPSIKEQTKIANFLSTIDKKIDQTETQIQQTQEWKKGLLQQMFV